ncbi:hypothetical protein I352_04693 [Cryptococcus deuterogattii MMRL2647]|nr:hypothetical protein I352_04693 [Cryptococcus deuterogattii MMRL2647]
MFFRVNILILALFGLLASAAPFKERSGAPINGMTLSVDSGKLCEGHQVNISWGDTSLGAVSCIHPEFSTLMLVASRHTIFSSPANKSLVFQVSDALKAKTYIQNQIVQPSNYCDIVTQPPQTIEPVASFVKPIFTVPTLSSSQNQVDQVNPPSPVSSISSKESCHVLAPKPREVNIVDGSAHSDLDRRTAH